MPLKYFMPLRERLRLQIEEEERKLLELQRLQRPPQPSQSQQPPWWQKPLEVGVAATFPWMRPEFEAGLRGVQEPFKQYGMMHYGVSKVATELGFPKPMYPLSYLMKDVPPTEPKEGVSPFLPGGALRTEYEQQPWYTQLLAELPSYMAIPTAAGAGGKLAGIAARGGKFAKAARIGAKALKPIARAEALPGKAIGKVAGKLGAKLAARQTARETARQEVVIAKLTKLIKSYKPVKKVAGKMKHEEWVKRVRLAGREIEKGKGAPEAYSRAMKKLAGKIPTPEAITLKEQLTSKDYISLVKRIYATGEPTFKQIRTKKALDKLLLAAEIPTQSELVLLEKTYGAEFIKAVLKHRQGWGTIALDVLNSPRAVLASFDFSFPLRQGIFEFLRHPIAGFKGLPRMIRAAFSEKYLTQIDDGLKAMPYFQRGQEMKLFHAPLPTEITPGLAARAEPFMARYVTKGKWNPIRMSERAFISMGNWQRQTSWNAFCTKWEGKGLLKADYQAMAHLINVSTGRGSFGKYNQLAPILSTFLFSPRYQLSRLQLPAMLFSKSPVVRKEAWIRLGEFVGTGFTILAMLKRSGMAEIETNPRSTDFAKIKIGNTRLDIWAGFQQYARLAVQMSTAQRKKQSGEITDVSRYLLLDYFKRTKEAPFVGLMEDLLRGSGYRGGQIELTVESARMQAYERLMPMWLADAWEAYNEQGLYGGLITSPGMFGVGAMTYPPEETKPQALPGLFAPRQGKTKLPGLFD